MSEYDDRNRILAALRHPLRRDILQMMEVREEPISPSQAATELEESLSDVAYHFRVLAACGAATLVEEKPVRGATQHFYRFSLEAEWAKEMLRESKD